MANSDSQTSRYGYDPSQTAAIAVAVIYSIAFIITLVQWIRYRAWVWVVMVIAAGMEAFGYIARSISAKHVDQKNIYVAQFALIVLSPVMMAAANYVIFGRIVFHVVPAHERTLKLLWISPRFVTPVFVICDILALLLQLGGALLITTTSVTTSNAASKLQKGKNIAITGVVIQMACFGLFSIIAGRFNFTSKRFKNDFNKRVTDIDGKYSLIDGQHKLKRNWQALLLCVNLACILITIRSIYRLVDFELGKTGYTEKHEWCAYVFDALPIFPCVALFTYWHPAKYLPYLGFRLPKYVRQGVVEHQLLDMRQGGMRI
ncbi:RTA1 like protein-domain-containing protein [Xylogone sp. PMI_703]|nr:RTA1 like protein-domain-containing protein [Xylogone sp. PMI_703]